MSLNNMSNIMEIIRIEVVGGGLTEHEMWVAGSTADIETGQRLIIKRPLCPFAFCNYKCLNISVLQHRAVFHTFIRILSIGMKSCMLTVVYSSILQHQFHS